MSLSEREYWSGDSQTGYGTLWFYSEQRADGLSKLISTSTSLTLEFERRHDLLTYIRAHLSSDERDVIRFTDEIGNDVNIRPFTVRLTVSSLSAFVTYLLDE